MDSPAHHRLNGGFTSHFQSGSIGIVVVVRIGRRSHNRVKLKFGATLWRTRVRHQDLTVITPTVSLSVLHILHDLSTLGPKRC